MNHFATVQFEFIKEAGKWKDLSREDQKAYLKRHPKSKRRLTKREKQKTEVKPNGYYTSVKPFDEHESFGLKMTDDPVVAIFKNPSNYEMNEEFSKKKSARGLIDDKGDIYLWDGDVDHKHITPELPEFYKKKIIPIDMDLINNKWTVHVSEWSFSTTSYSKNDLENMHDILEKNSTVKANKWTTRDK
jgi:hypothetical protein